MEVEVFFNPNCSKCRTVRGILEERGVDATFVRYLEQTPSREELERVLRMLGSDDPRVMMRTNEPEYRQLSLANADREQLLDAMIAHPRLIQRPIVIRNGKAVIGRPPDRVLQLLEE
ncbi:MAG: arsenate reductase (glutaredoxin) [Actinomycetota bacterium]|nr:arsenate reductase (glutaredoxin) [Actinomycetota bacterium]